MLTRRPKGPFFAGLGATLLALAIVRPFAADAAGQWDTWHTSGIVERGGYPVFAVDGRPFFVYGAAFFYERVPRDRWRASLLQYRSIGINTIDLYVIWNWHEPSEGAFDFDGHSDPRRDLMGVLVLCRQLGLHVILRPGPVIRNEWRNGGYPDWLLQRPEYDMPRHDVLEGRYPATATLQNAHADAAAVQWLANPTHLRYASAWLSRVLTTVAPYAHDVIAIALDDDQGAYIDNDTWPGPHWHDYIGWLAAQVRAVTGPRVPLFLNTFDMKVTAASPVWAWGDWYQSDAFAIGEHDRAQLDFSLAMLRTQPLKPAMLAEFQAGWLQGAGEPAPRAADPSNTDLALRELLSSGAHGVVNFPLQDTAYPSGWEAPWANWAYAWDAAFRLDGTNARLEPSARFGSLLARFGSALAKTHVAAQAAIVWPASLYDPPTLTNRDVATMQTATIAAQQSCRDLHLVCDAIDLRFAPASTIARYAQIVLLPLALPDAADVTPEAKRTIAHLAARGVLVGSVARIATSPPVAALPGAVLLLGDAPGDTSFANVVNWGDAALHARNVRVRLPTGKTTVIASVDVAPRSGTIVPLRSTGTSAQADFSSPPAPTDIQAEDDAFAFATGIWSVQTPAHEPGVALAFAQDVLHDGSEQIVMQNDRLRIIFSPNAGARVFVLQARTTGPGGKVRWGPNVASSAGLLRDDVGAPPAPSSRDYIAAYTHPFPTGTFNRRYDCNIRSKEGREVSVQCDYDAPDIPVGGGGRFARTLTLNADSDSVRVTEWLQVRGTDERLVSVNAFACPLHPDGCSIHPIDRRFEVLSAGTLVAALLRYGGADVDASPQNAIISVTMQGGGSFEIGVPSR